jgi:hypothetical protein
MLTCSREYKLTIPYFETKVKRVFLGLTAALVVDIVSVGREVGSWAEKIDPNPSWRGMPWRPTRKTIERREHVGSGCTG